MHRVNVQYTLGMPSQKNAKCSRTQNVSSADKVVGTKGESHTWSHVTERTLKGHRVIKKKKLYEGTIRLSRVWDIRRIREFPHLNLSLTSNNSAYENIQI